MIIEDALAEILEYQKHYRELVGRPGKYEGEKPYIVYFNEKDWESSILTDDTDGECIRKWEITESDVLLFPELEDRYGRDFIYVHVSPDGFVSQTDKKQWDAFERLLAERNIQCRCGETMQYFEVPFVRLRGEELVGKMFKCTVGHLTWWGEEKK